MKTLAVLVLFMTLSSAQAGPVTALACQNAATGNFATVGIRTELFAPSTQRILHYVVKTGKVVNGERVTNEKIYEAESNMKIFDSDEGAYEYIKANSIVIPLQGANALDSVLLVDSAKKQVSLIDPVYETIEVLDCLIN